jgi:hypothetical protein
MRRAIPLSALSLTALLALPLQAQESAAMVASPASPVAGAVAPEGIALRHRPASLELPSATALADRASDAPTPAPRADGFASSGFAQFMASPAGRILRVVAGAGMIAGGINADSDAGTAVAIVGAVPLLAGTFDFCILSPLFGGPLSGKAIRAAK